MRRFHVAGAVRKEAHHESGTPDPLALRLLADPAARRLRVPSGCVRPVFAATLYTVTDVGGPQFIAYDVNNPGRVVGAASIPAPEWSAAQWDKGVATQLPSLGGTLNLARDIDESGKEIVGKALASGETAFHAVLWSGGAIQTSAPSAAQTVLPMASTTAARSSAKPT